MGQGNSASTSDVCFIGINYVFPVTLMVVNFLALVSIEMMK